MKGRLMLVFKCFIKPFEGLHVISAPLFDYRESESERTEKRIIK